MTGAMDDAAARNRALALAQLLQMPPRTQPQDAQPQLSRSPAITDHSDKPNGGVQIANTPSAGFNGSAQSRGGKGRK